MKKKWTTNISSLFCPFKTHYSFLVTLSGVGISVAAQQSKDVPQRLDCSLKFVTLNRLTLSVGGGFEG